MAPLLWFLAAVGMMADTSLAGEGFADSPERIEKMLGRGRIQTAVPKAEGRPVEGGHNAQYHVSNYDIWLRNCHTMANGHVTAALQKGQRAGILACGGDPTRNPAHHTAAWSIVQASLTCIYNYGESCCWQASANPPDISSGRGQDCARAACGDQYGTDTRMLPEGHLVEAPGPHSCAVEAAGGPANLPAGPAQEALAERMRTRAETIRVRSTVSNVNSTVLHFAQGGLAACQACCAKRVAMWATTPAASVTANLASGRKDEFNRRCSSACRATFDLAP